MDDREEGAVLRLLSGGSVAIVRVVRPPCAVAAPQPQQQFRTTVCVLQGSVTIETPHERWELGPDAVCELARGLPHKEIAGPDGAVMLMGFN